MSFNWSANTEPNGRRRLRRRCCGRVALDVIVTRDTDYGAIHENGSNLNDWLKQEFSERVSKKRKVILTDKLSQGLKLVHAAVTREMEQEEELLLNRIRPAVPKEFEVVA